METLGEAFLPETEEEATRMAVRDILRAASFLTSAADLAPEDAQVDHYINSAIRLRDLASFLLPERQEWPENVIQFVPRPRWRD